MKILVLVEHDNHNVKPATYSVLTAAKQLGNDIDLLVSGESCTTVIDELKKFSVVKQIFLADGKDYANPLAENIAMLLADIGSHYTYILAPSTTFGKNILPRAAALLDTAMVSDVTRIISADTFERPIYAGNAIATVCATDPIKILSIRTTAFSVLLPEGEFSPAIQKIEKNNVPVFSRWIAHELTQSARPELTSARKVVSGGRALKSAENFKLIEALADQLGAAIGASRAAVDAGFAPNDYQVGQTGKMVAPDLYIAIGISGAIQHIAGMKDSKVIVAINQDADAPIFEIADYGLVADLFTAIPELISVLENKAL